MCVLGHRAKDRGTRVMWDRSAIGGEGKGGRSGDEGDEMEKVRVDRCEKGKWPRLRMVDGDGRWVVSVEGGRRGEDVV